MNLSPIIEVRHLSKTFPSGVAALKDVSFSVKPGEFLVVIGLSGSGKSTLLRCLNRLIEPSSGELFFEGSDITHARENQSRQIRRKMAMIFQNFNLIGRRSVLKNVLTGRLGYVSTWKSLLGQYSIADRESALKNLDLVGIRDKAAVRSSDLSGGQQQRVAIARALTQEPKVLLADEPVASLDPATCHVIMDYLQKINRELGITIICNLHFLSLVRQYATRVIALRDGGIVYDGSPAMIDNDWFKKIYGVQAREVQID